MQFTARLVFKIGLIAFHAFAVTAEHLCAKFDTNVAVKGVDAANTERTTVFTTRILVKLARITTIWANRYDIYLAVASTSSANTALSIFGLAAFVELLGHWATQTCVTKSIANLCKGRKNGGGKVTVVHICYKSTIEISFECFTDKMDIIRVILHVIIFV